jgi:DNA-binding transcriptional LysR family regulator
MEIRQLQFFLDIAATGSFSRAATLSATSQSTVSKSISELESELGVRLFQRTGRGAALTAAGIDLLPQAEGLVADSIRLKGWMSERQGRLSGTVRLAIQPGLSWPLLEAVLSDLGQSHPEISLQVSEGTTNQIEEWLGEGRVEIGVLSRTPSSASAESWPLFSLPLLLVSRPGALSAQGLEWPFDWLDGVNLVLSTARNGARLLIEEAAQRRGLTLRVALEINALGLIKQVVAHGPLCTVAAWPAVYQEVTRGELAVHRLTQPELRHVYHVAIASRRAPTPAVRYVADAIQRFRPPAAWQAELMT